jgi:hypothetical protein
MLKKLAAFLGALCLVLLVMAFDEGQVERGVVVVRDKLGPAIETLRERAKASIPTPVATPTVPESRAITGDFLPRAEDAPGGALSFDLAVLVFEGAPALRTRPHRIALGGEPAVAELGLPADRQVELREVVPLDARTPVAASPLCDGDRPGWIAVAREGGDLSLLVWRAGPAPDAPGATPCGRFDYEGGAR